LVTYAPRCSGKPDTTRGDKDIKRGKGNPGGGQETGRENTYSVQEGLEAIR